MCAFRAWSRDPMTARPDFIGERRLSGAVAIVDATSASNITVTLRQYALLSQPDCYNVWRTIVPYMSQRAVGDGRMARALLTEGERDALTDEEMDSNTRSTHMNRIKNKLGALGEDARILRENAPEIYEEAREEFCEAELDERIERLEDEVQDLRDQVDSD